MKFSLTKINAIVVVTKVSEVDIYLGRNILDQQENILLVITLHDQTILANFPILELTCDILACTFSCSLGWIHVNY